MAFAVASTALHDLLRAHRRPLQVLASLPSAVYLQVGGRCPAGQTARAGSPAIVALLARDAVRVPIGMLVALPRMAAPFAGLQAGQTGAIGDGALSVGGQDYRPLRYWDPRVPQLRAGLATPAAIRRCEALGALTDQLPADLRAALAEAGAAGTGAAGNGSGRVAGTERDAARGVERDGALGTVLGDPLPHPAALANAVRGLIGLGPGLTPAGDDVLAGALLALGAAGDLPRQRALAEAVGGLLDRTTPLSAVLLDQACRSRAVPEVGALLRALACGGDLDSALVALSLVGHTSGPALALGIRLALRARAGHSLGRAA